MHIVLYALYLSQRSVPAPTLEAPVTEELTKDAALCKAMNTPLPPEQPAPTGDPVPID